jgi:hypothetical protein
MFSWYHKFVCLKEVMKTNVDSRKDETRVLQSYFELTFTLFYVVLAMEGCAATLPLRQDLLLQQKEQNCQFENTCEASIYHVYMEIDNRGSASRT